MKCRFVFLSMFIICLLIPFMLLNAQFRPYGVSGRVVDVAVYNDHAVILSSISGMGYGYSWNGPDSGQVSGLFLGLIKGDRVDTVARWLASFDRYAGWGIEPIGLSETSSGLWFGYYNTSDVGAESLQFWRLNEAHDSLTLNNLFIPVTAYWWPNVVKHVHCSDSIVIETGVSGKCVKWKSKDYADTVDCETGMVLDWTLNKALFSNVLWLMHGCNIESSVSLSSPAIPSTVHFNTPTLLVGWTGKQGAWSTDDGRTWVLSDSLDRYIDTLFYTYHHTTDGYDVIAEWLGRYNQTMPAQVYIMSALDSAWFRYSIPNSNNVQNIYGDSLSNLYIAFDNYLSFPFNSDPPNLWKYDPTVSVNEPPFTPIRNPATALTEKYVVKDLSTLNNVIFSGGSWALYSGMGVYIMSSADGRQSLPDVPAGLYVVTQVARYVVVLVTD